MIGAVYLNGELVGENTVLDYANEMFFMQLFGGFGVRGFQVFLHDKNSVSINSRAGVVRFEDGNTKYIAKINSISYDSRKIRISAQFDAFGSVTIKGLTLNRFTDFGRNLVLFMPANEGSGNVIYDWSGVNNHGTAYNHSWVSGYLSFNGTNSYVSVAHNSNLNPTAGISYGLYAYRSNWRNITSTMYMLDKSGYRLGVNNTNVFCEIYIGGSYRTINYPVRGLSDGWHFFGVFYDGSIMKFFVDERLAGTLQITGSISYPTSNANLMIGASASGNYFSGYLDGIFVATVPVDDMKVVFATPDVSYGTIAYYPTNVSMQSGDRLVINWVLTV